MKDAGTIKVTAPKPERAVPSGQNGLAPRVDLADVARPKTPAGAPPPSSKGSISYKHIDR